MSQDAGGQVMECVPNFSEGRRADVIERLQAAAMAVAGVHLLDTHTDPDHNRSVLTLAGDPRPLLDAAFDLARVAVEAIDLRSHEGVHPRMGAVDVIPLVPLSGLTLDDCAGAARDLGRRIAGELGVPVYLYGAAASPGRETVLAAIRGDGFEALMGLGKGLVEPDFGRAALHPSAGAVAVGARLPLIAINVLVEGGGEAVAARLARRVRSSSGGLPAVQAKAFVLPATGALQVSMNLLDYKRTGIGDVLELLSAEAAETNARITRCELVGLAPAESLAGLERFSIPGVPGPGQSIERRLQLAIHA